MISVMQVRRKQGLDIPKAGQQMETVAQATWIRLLAWSYMDHALARWNNMTEPVCKPLRTKSGKP